MQAPERTPLSRKTADALEQEIRDGRWQDKLPGYRKLCEMLGVSPRTMHSALEILTRRKVILPAERTKPRMVHPDIAGGDARVPVRTSLLILSKTPFQEQELVARRILEKVVVIFNRKGWTVNFESSPEFADGTPGPVMKRMLKNRGDHRWLMIRPPFSVIDWCMENDLRIICLGGEPEHLKPPLVASSTSRMLNDSITRLAKLGHRRICALMSYRSDESKARVSGEISKNMKQLGIDFHQTYNLPDIRNNDARSFWSSLNDLFSVSPPSALIATEVDQLISIYSYCLEKGLRIPQDLSVVVTQQASNLEWFHPLPAHYEYPVNKFVRKIRRLIEHYPTDDQEIELLSPLFKEGKSLARVR